MKYLSNDTISETMEGDVLYNKLMNIVDDIRWNDRIEGNRLWIMKTQKTIASFIIRRRRQILVHSYLYYVLDTNIIDDCTWSKWGQQLVDISEAYPDIANCCEFADDFESFDGSTGAFFDWNSEDMIGIIQTAMWLKV